MKFKSKISKSIILSQPNEAFQIRSDEYAQSQQRLNLSSLVDQISEIQDLFWLKNLNQTATELKRLKKGWFRK
jgi:hypothetical protein